MHLSLLPLLAVCLMCASAPVHAAKVYRCPDGSYADKPCGEGARVVTTTRRTSPKNETDRICMDRGSTAEAIARRREAGASPGKAIAAVDNEYIPYEEKSARRKLVVQVYRIQGTPAEVRSIVETECLKPAEEDAAARDAKAARQAKEAAAAAPAQKPQSAPETPSQSAGAQAKSTLSRKQCEELQQMLGSMSQPAMPGEEAPEDERASRRNDRRNLSRQLKEVCAP